MLGCNASWNKRKAIIEAQKKLARLLENQQEDETR
jgi:hypothetical protein